MPEAIASSPTPEILDQFRCVAKMFSDAQIRAEQRAKSTHERFNVFTTLLSISDEVRLHTRFLHCLLDPKGSHDCGTLFLDLFFKTLAEFPGMDHSDNPVFFEPPQLQGKWAVEKEASRGSVGKIDLLLEQSNFAIAVENKIYAFEQQNQLTRYSSYLHGRYGEAFKVIYLTLDGKKSGTHGENACYIRISYTEHILEWLDKCLRDSCRMPSINQVIVQYREVVRRLTSKTTQESEMQTIADYISQNPGIIRFRRQIDEGIKAVRCDFLDRLADGIIENLRDGFQVRFRSNLVQGRFGVDPNGAIVINPPKGNPLAQERFEIWMEYIAKWGGLVIGIESKYEKPPLNERQTLILEKINQLLIQDSKTNGYIKAQPMASWNGTYWPTGWRNLIYPLDDQELAKLLDTPLQETVSDLCCKIRGQIESLERAYLEAASGQEFL